MITHKNGPLRPLRRFCKKCKFRRLSLKYFGYLKYQKLGFDKDKSLRSSIESSKVDFSKSVNLYLGSFGIRNSLVALNKIPRVTIEGIHVYFSIFGVLMYQELLQIRT